MKNTVSILFFCLFSLSFSALAQEKSKKELKAERELQKQKEVQALIDNRSFVFEAQRLTPQGGRLINLDYNMYFLKFNAENTTCDLPFFGRGFNVGYGGSDGGIKFEGKPENIKIESKTKSTTIKTTVKGQNDVYNLMFNIFYNGTATLSVNSNNRGPISYDGIVSAPKDTSKK
jgi:hypothetical protein